MMPRSHTFQSQSHSMCAQRQHQVAMSTCTEQSTATDIIQSHIVPPHVYVIWAQVVLLRQLQSRLPLPMSDETGQLVLRTLLSDGHPHSSPHHCGTLATFVLQEAV